MGESGGDEYIRGEVKNSREKLVVRGDAGLCSCDASQSTGMEGMCDRNKISIDETCRRGHACIT